MQSDTCNVVTDPVKPANSFQAISRIRYVQPAIGNARGDNIAHRIDLFTNIKLHLSTAHSLEDCRIAVLMALVTAPDVGLEVKRIKAERIASPAISRSPSVMMIMPRRNRPSPPSACTAIKSLSATLVYQSSIIIGNASARSLCTLAFAVFMLLLMMSTNASS